MTGRHRTACGVGVVAGLWAAWPGKLEACATCFGASDSAMAQGMNMGIMVLLGFIGFVMVGLVCFFGYLAVRSRRAAWFEELKDEVAEELAKMDRQDEERGIRRTPATYR